jgi:hypothetical protein
MRCFNIMTGGHYSHDHHVETFLATHAQSIIEALRASIVFAGGPHHVSPRFFANARMSWMDLASTPAERAAAVTLSARRLMMGRSLRARA